MDLVQEDVAHKLPQGETRLLRAGLAPMQPLGAAARFMATVAAFGTHTAHQSTLKRKVWSVDNPRAPLCRAMGCRSVLAVAPLLLLAAYRTCTAQPEACPGYSEQLQGAARLIYQASIPGAHLEDIFTPQRFSELLGQLVDGLQLEVLSVDTNVTIGAFGEIWQLPLSTSDGRSLYDAGSQYPWSGEAQLVLGNVTGPTFGLDQRGDGGAPLKVEQTSAVQVPYPDFSAAQAVANFNAQAATASDWSLYAALNQMMACNASWPQLSFQDPRLRSLLNAADDGSLTLQDVVEVSPALASLFPDAANGTEPLAGLQHAYIRRQFWPLLRDGQWTGLLTSSVSFASEEDALAGRDAFEGEMRVDINTNLWTGPTILAPVGEAALRDVQVIMTALQQQL